MGNDMLKGGAGRDKFVLSTGQDVFRDFNLDDGDVIDVDPDLEFKLQQKGDNVRIKADDNIETVLINMDKKTLLDSDPFV